MPLAYVKTIPISPFMAVCPIRAMARAMPNAVPDNEG